MKSGNDTSTLLTVQQVVLCKSLVRLFWKLHPPFYGISYIHHSVWWCLFWVTTFMFLWIKIHCHSNVYATLLFDSVGWLSHSSIGLHRLQWHDTVITFAYIKAHTYTHTHTLAHKHLIPVNTIPIYNCITAESSLRLSGHPLLQSSLPRWLSIFSPISSQFLSLLFFNDSLSPPHQRPSQIPHLLSLIILKLIKLLTPHADAVVHMLHGHLAQSCRIYLCIHIYVYMNLSFSYLYFFLVDFSVLWHFLHITPAVHHLSYCLLSLYPFLKVISWQKPPTSFPAVPFSIFTQLALLLCSCKRSLLSEILIWQARQQSLKEHLC